MKKFKYWLGVLLVLGAQVFPFQGMAATDRVVQGIKTDRLTLIFDSTPLANLTFQLDCMADLIHCDQNAILPIWKTASWTSEDDANLRKWSELQHVYRDFELSLPDASNEELRKVGFPLRHRGVSFEQKFRLIGLSARDLKEYRKEVGFLTSPQDAAEFASIVERFEPRFMTWWQKSGFKTVSGFTTGFASLMKEKGISAFLERTTVFYRSHGVSGSPIYIHFIALPTTSGHSSGEQIENHGIVEVLSGEKPVDRIDVICHEIFHYFYSLASSKDHLFLVSAFAQSSKPDAIPAYNLLNEALATALGNGIVARMTHTSEWYEKTARRQRSFYNDNAIDAVAKKVIPELDEALKNGTTLYDPKFIEGYLAAVRAALADQAQAPQLYLRKAAFIYEKPFEADYTKFYRAIHGGDSYETTDLDSDRAIRKKLSDAAHLSALIMVKPKHLEALKHWKAFIPSQQLQAIKNQAKRRSPFIYFVPRNKNSWIFVLVAEPGQQAWQLLHKLAETPKLPKKMVSF
jgi:hypothetical protein